MGASSGEHAPSHAYSMDGFWSVLPDSARRAHAAALKSKDEDEFPRVTFNVAYTQLHAGLQQYSTLCHALTANDSTVTLVLVFRDEAFRYVVYAPAYVDVLHALCFQAPIFSKRPVPPRALQVLLPFLLPTASRQSCFVL